MESADVTNRIAGVNSVPDSLLPYFAEVFMVEFLQQTFGASKSLPNQKHAWVCRWCFMLITCIKCFVEKQASPAQLKCCRVAAVDFPAPGSACSA